jgi:hypothetical protein
MLPCILLFYIEAPLLLFKLKLGISLFPYPTLFVRQTTTILQGHFNIQAGAAPTKGDWGGKQTSEE